MPRKKQITPSLYSLSMRGFMGINNVIPAEKCKPAELQTAINADINDAMQAIRRQGHDKVYSGTDVHSVFANGVNGNASFMLFKEGSTLKKLNSDFTATTLRSGISRTKWMNYLALNNLVYYSDEIITGITDGVMSRSWGLEIPAYPTLAQTTGALPSGRYLCAITYVRSDKQEGGASKPIYIDVSSNSGITVSSIPVSSDTDVSFVNIYLSTRNGEVLYLAKTVANGITSTSYAGNTTEFKIQLATLYVGPPKPGHIIQYHGGRIYVVSGSAAWYTLPYNYELMDLAHGHLSFPDRITLFAPVDGGIWVSYLKGKTFFLEGTDPEKGFVTHWKTDHPAYEGSQKLDEITFRGEVTKVWRWMADDGIYEAIDGSLFNKTEDRYIPVSADLAVSFLKKTEDGSKQYGSVLY